MCIICDPARKEEMEAATHLYCNGCPTVTHIPVLPNLTALYCRGCPLLTTLPALPDLAVLESRNCPLLTALPELPKLEQLSCVRCPLLTAIPALSELKILACYECPLLATLSALPNLVYLNCRDCPLLASLPVPLPHLTRLYCDLWINHPLNERFPAAQKAAHILARRRLKKLRYVRFKKFISTPQYSAYLNSPGHVGHRIETAQLCKLGSERS